MALFWSKKPKAEKNYESEVRKAKTAPGAARNARRAPSSAGKRAQVAAGASLEASASAAKASPIARVAAPSGRFDAATAVIIRPHVTEKSGLAAQSGVYTFAVSRDADKPAVMKAVKALYKVSPVKVNFVRLPAKAVWARGKWGSVSGIRKAIVTVKKGDKIDFV